MFAYHTFISHHMGDSPSTFPRCFRPLSPTVPMAFEYYPTTSSSGAKTSTAPGPTYVRSSYP